MFGEIPAYGFFIRHVKGIELNNVEVSYLREDLRPAFVLIDLSHADFFHVKAQRSASAPVFDLTNVTDFNAQQCRGVTDIRLEHADRKKL